MTNRTRNLVDGVLVVFVIWSVIFLSGQNVRKTTWVSSTDGQVAQVTTPPKDSSYPPEDHGTVISKQWTHTRNDSKNNLPDGWPSEHRLLFSWGHNRQPSSTWPANHELLPSKGWPRSFHLHSISQTWIGHTLALSATMPNEPWPGHNQALSATWPPNHSFDISPSWNTDRTHSVSYSQTWPPGHGKVVSLDYLEPTLLRPGHTVALSQNCDPNQPWEGRGSCTLRKLPVHREEDSAGWPFNHGPRLSRVWPTNHSNDISLTWPANHLLTASKTWPANHSPVTSQSRPSNSVFTTVPVNLNWLLVEDHLFRTSVQNISSNPTPQLIYGRKSRSSSSSSSATLDTDGSSSNSSVSAPASLE